MSAEKPWYFTLFERAWYDELAPGGARSPIALEQFARNTDREVDFIEGTLALAQPARLLDLCCGWGRHTIRLAQRGYVATGLDLSAYHIELARDASRRAGVQVNWIEGDMRRLPFPEASFDAVINMFTAFGYFDDRENQDVLDEVARVLAPGGRFLIDVIHRDYLMGVFRDSDWREDQDGGLILERRRWDASAGRIHAEWILIDADGRRRVHPHDERVYTLQELGMCLQSAGLHVRAVSGEYDGSPLTRTSRRLIVLAEKP